LEFVKSGKLVPLQFSSRHYDFGGTSGRSARRRMQRSGRFSSGRLLADQLRGGEVWLGDATEAQYLQTTTDHLAEVANQMASAGLITLARRYATALPALMARGEEFEAAWRAAVEALEQKHAFERG
jgi:hypothetical protein